MKLMERLKNCFRKIEVKIKLLHKEAIIPKFSTIGSAGADLYSIEDIAIPKGKCALIRTGIAIELPSFTEAQIRSRSGLASKKRVFVLNSPATIDEDYRGEVKVILMNLGDKDYIVHKGDKIAQMVVKRTYNVSFKIVSKLSETVRGTGGFGSTGK